jgi:hypothetical protein
MAGFPEVFSVCSTQLAYAFSDFLSSLTSALLVFLVPTNPDCALVAIGGENMRPVTVVIVEEVKSGDWGIGGKPLTTAESLRKNPGPVAVSPYSVDAGPDKF